MNGQWKPTASHRVGLYARVSSDQQAEEATIDSQLAALRERIQADGGVLDPALCFVDDGVSGTTLLRPALERLRDLAAAGGIERLYVLAPDRLARRYAHQLILNEELQACGVEMVFLNRTLARTPEDQLLLQVQGVIAEYEHAKILERTRRGRRHAARCGRVSVLSRAAFGYRYVDKHAGGGTAAWEVVEDEAAVVRQIFTWVGRDGCSLREVARRLERQGVRTRQGHRRWAPGTIAGMLRNPAYRGQAVFGKRRHGERRPQLRPRRGQPEVAKYSYSVYRQPVSEHIAIAVPAVVSADLFAAVQERLEENRRRLRETRRGARHLLQGLLVCGCCGYALSGQTSRADYSYYGCPGRHNTALAERCPNPPQRTEALDAAVWNDVCALLSEPERLGEEFERRQQTAATPQSSVEKQSLDKAIHKVKQSLARLIDAYAAGLLEREEFEPRIRRWKEQLTRLEEEQRLLTEQAQHQKELRLVCSHLADFADQIKAGLATADWGQRREILRALLKRVEVEKKSLRIVYKVPVRPFVRAPAGGQLQDCQSRPREKHERNQGGQTAPS